MYILLGGGGQESGNAVGNLQPAEEIIISKNVNNYKIVDTEIKQKKWWDDN